MPVFLLLMNVEVAAASANDTEKLKVFIDGVIYSQMDENNIVGATVAVIQDGEIILTKGLRLRRPGKPGPGRPGSRSLMIAIPTWPMATIISTEPTTVAASNISAPCRQAV